MAIITLSTSTTTAATADFPRWGRIELISFLVLQEYQRLPCACATLSPPGSGSG